jgi:MYXO-CTERM domain-containing protein
MRTIKTFVVLFILLFVVAACNSQRQAAAERIGKTNQALLTQGSPCLQNSHCETGFCVDAVCCENACGGGERDNFACSNIYGTVPGLVDGKCTQLQPGDACGKLETFDPCTWRGTILNGGHNCPNPPFGATSVACYDCSAGQTCPDGVPVCVGGQCLGCNGNFGSGATRACPTSVEPACVDGACLECSLSDTSACTIASGKPICDFPNHVCIPGCLANTDCSGTTPICNLVTHQCVPCNGDYLSLSSAACYLPTEPACLPNGDCVECDADTLTACTPAKPNCNVTTHTCVECNATADCTGIEVCNPVTSNCEPPCTTNGDCSGSTPVCVFPPGVCVECTPTDTTNCPVNEPKCNNNECVGCITGADCPDDKPVCDPTSHTCTATCTASAQCPGDTPICNPATHVCVECTDNSDCPASEPICNPATGQCGTTCTESVQCPGDKPICNPVTKTCVECTSNTNCVLPEVCDTTTGTCGPCTTSAQCPGDTPICDPATKKCVECTSNANCTAPEVCDTTTGTCTQECTTSAQCPGDTPVCDPATKKCVDCVTNTDCPTGQICNQSTKKCEPPKPGQPPPQQPQQPPQASPSDAFDIQGAGCNCSTTGDDRQSGTPALLGFGLALTLLVRRRKHAA